MFLCFLVPAPGAPGNTVGSGGGQGNNMVQLSTTGGGSSGLNPSIHRPSISQNQQRQASDCSSSQHTVSNLVTMLSFQSFRLPSTPYSEEIYCKFASFDVCL